ncbi:MAG: hypothetical protein K9N01_08760, partial [Cephaloticoccus sp.]|nr:hypothetical protein [Cephaloticoccus sp.]
TMRMISHNGSPADSWVVEANRRNRVPSMGELSWLMTGRSTPSHLAVALGPRQSNHSAGSSQSQKALASS